MAARRTFVASWDSSLPTLRGRLLELHLPGQAEGTGHDNRILGIHAVEEGLRVLPGNPLHRILDDGLDPRVLSFLGSSEEGPEGIRSEVTEKGRKLPGIRGDGSILQGLNELPQRLRPAHFFEDLLGRGALPGLEGVLGSQKSGQFLENGPGGAEGTPTQEIGEQDLEDLQNLPLSLGKPGSSTRSKRAARTSPRRSRFISIRISSWIFPISVGSRE